VPASRVLVGGCQSFVPWPHQRLAQPSRGLAVFRKGCGAPPWNACLSRAVRGHGCTAALQVPDRKPLNQGTPPKRRTVASRYTCPATIGDAGVSVHALFMLRSRKTPTNSSNRGPAMPVVHNGILENCATFRKSMWPVCNREVTIASLLLPPGRQFGTYPGSGWRGIGRRRGCCSRSHASRS
jgi:hypothetical protein